jgi:hypothetical protein
MNTALQARGAGVSLCSDGEKWVGELSLRGTFRRREEGQHSAAPDSE